jgi:hypothetical protein
MLGGLALLAGGLLLWSFVGNPPRAARFRASQELTSNADVQHVSKESPYMRTER